MNRSLTASSSDIGGDVLHLGLLLAFRRITYEKTAPNFSEAVFHLGVADGTRTRDSQDHNLVLYQLNYSHHDRVVRPCRY